MTSGNHGLHYIENIQGPQQIWEGAVETIAFEPAEVQARLLNLEQPCYVVKVHDQIGVSNDGNVSQPSHPVSGAVQALIATPPLPVHRLGDPMFRDFHQVNCAYTSGAMANGIASEDLVIAMGQAGFLSSFGAAGLLPTRIEAAIHRLQHALPQGPYAFNLIHSPSEAALESATVNLYLQHRIRTVEASAYLDLTPHIVYYRATGLRLNSANQIEIGNRVIAKLSRREIAAKFLQPAPAKLLAELVTCKLISDHQASLAAHVPMADDITVEADSGGHTDNRPLVSLFPSIVALRDELQTRNPYDRPVRIGAAGGMGTPAAALAAFMMGAAYVVSGSVNQSCVEAAASQHTKDLLAQADIADIAMAPAADMFEMGVKLQVLKRGTFFPIHAQKLYELYRAHDSIEALPRTERERLETRIFRRDLDAIWEETQAYFTERDPEQIARAISHPKRKMALIFRWYLGLSSHWSNTGDTSRETDYQIWCGPAMGAFNDWVRGSYLAEPSNRRVTEVARHMMMGAAFLYRLHHLRLLGLQLPAHVYHYRLTPFTEMARSGHHVVR